MIGSTRKRSAIAGLFLLIFGAVKITQAQVTETALYSFQSAPKGAIPNSALVRDAGGNLYGTTLGGGAYGLGAVYKVDAAGNETVLYSFASGNNGDKPAGGLAIDGAGNLYGTAEGGGVKAAGLVFKVDASGRYKVMYNFKGGSDGRFPSNGVTLDSSGNLYGTTHEGGVHNQGVIFKVDAAGRETVLYRFPGGAAGSQPSSGVTLDGAGNLYGTTRYGGAHIHGVVYKLDASGKETVLSSFTRSQRLPSGNLVLDGAGNLYGTTVGSLTSTDRGMVYKLNPAGVQTVLYRFRGGAYGGNPDGGVVLDTDGNLYGVAKTGGTDNNGVVYKISPTAGETVLHKFESTIDGGGPNGVIRDSAGNLYGTTYYGGPFAGFGTVFLLNPAGTETVLYGFLAGNRGANPNTGVVLDAAGNVYGTTNAGGGRNNGGVVYKLDPSGRETVLQTFGGGAGPGAVALDSAGNLYGTGQTAPPGESSAAIIWKVNSAGQYEVLYSFGAGTSQTVLSGVTVDSSGNLYVAASSADVLYELSSTGALTLLHRFTDSDGVNPNGVILDSSGNLYGTTQAAWAGFGSVFKLDASGNFSVLYGFTGHADGGAPVGLPVIDPSGNLYGITKEGGSAGLGTLWELDAAGDFKVLHAFTLAEDGPPEFGSLARDAEGNLYGTTSAHDGLVFKCDTSGNLTVLYKFTGEADGRAPTTLTLDSAGNLYGTTRDGGRRGAGEVFKLSGVAAKTGGASSQAERR